jgi:hypothetical protein
MYTQTLEPLPAAGRQRAEGFPLTLSSILRGRATTEDRPQGRGEVRSGKTGAATPFYL